MIRSGRDDSKSAEATYAVVWPKSARAVQSRRAAPRLQSLHGARVAFAWDYMFRGEELFAALQQYMEQRFPGVEIIGYDAFGNTHGPEEAQVIGEIPSIVAARGITAVVSGIGC
jgi:hypothetical protein